MIAEAWHSWRLGLLKPTQSSNSTPTAPNLPKPCVTRSLRGYDVRLRGQAFLYHLPPENATSLDKLVCPTKVFLRAGSVLQTLPSSMLLTCMWVVPLGRLLLGSRQQTVLPLVLFSAPWNGAIGPEKNPSSLTNQRSANVHEGKSPRTSFGASNLEDRYRATT